MSFSPDVEESRPYPFRLGTFIENQIFEMHADIAAWQEIADGACETLEHIEPDFVKDILWCRFLQLKRFEHADIMLSRGDPSPALELRDEYLQRLAFFANQRATDNKEGANKHIEQINALRQITY
ncbi:hypothetical protein HY469_05025 [Candidatus Roizmanbacteria bacterium]|nr:hypothetical protein [Candidatus Roizmanbacteria bacterium]